MAGNIEARLEELNIELPNAASPAANYVPFVITGNQLWVAGQVPFWNGEITHRGKVGDTLSVDDGAASARICGLNIIAQAKSALGDLDRVVRFVKLGGFVNATPDFTDHPKVINGASDLIVEVFGDAGKHARFALGASGLPLNAATEVDAVIEIA
ncbi:MAG: RidA family protein [Alphaproteobacteria bacterium]|nr:RidA family protein [Alphaproteobacteria bacterium]